MPLQWPWSSRKMYTYMQPPHDEEAEQEDRLLSDEEKVLLDQTLLNKNRVFLRIFFALGAALILISLVLFFQRNFSIVKRAALGQQPPYGNPIPPPPLELRKFGPAEVFTDRQNERSDAAWEALAGPMLDEQGFISIPNARELNLPPGVRHGDRELYGISMFHQLHCLGAIRHVFWQLMDGTLDPIKFAAIDGDTSSPEFVPDGHGLWHLTHCFNYVRHALQCYGDTTIEVPTSFNGHNIFIGWNTTHQCRSFEAVWDYTVKHS